MKCSVISFRIRTGLGVQSITGIVDRTGASFVPEHILMINGSCVLETLWSNPTGAWNAASINVNFYRASDNAAGYIATADYPRPVPSIKVVSGGGGPGISAALDSLEADAVAGGNIYRTAKITSVYSGGFDIEVLTTTAWAFTTDVIILVLADLSIEYQPDTSVGSYPTTFQAKGLLNLKFPAFGNTGIVSTGTGSRNCGIGWDSPNGGPMSSHVYMGNQLPDHRYQSITTFNNDINLGPPVIKIDNLAISAWNPTNVVMSGTGTSNNIFYVGGTDIVTASKSFIQRTGIGTQVVDLGMYPLALFVASVGAIPHTTLQSDWCEMCIGFSNGVSQASHWFGEDCSAPPSKGANFISRNSIFRFAQLGPQGPTTAFTSIASLTEINPDGTFTLNWTSNDDVGRQLLCFGIGVAASVTPPTVPTITATGGLHFINSNKVNKNDSYYDGGELKIPSSVIKTALFGE